MAHIPRAEVPLDGLAQIIAGGTATLEHEQKRLCGKSLLAPSIATPRNIRLALNKAVVVVSLARFHPNEGYRVRVVLNACRF